MNLIRNHCGYFYWRITPLVAPLVLLLQAQICFAQNQLVAATNNFSLDPPPAAQLVPFGSRGVHVHDPSTIVKCGNEFWVFYTGRGVPSYHSKDLVNWEIGPPVFTNASAWTDQAVPAHRGSYFWAPDIIHLGDRYLLYYAVSTFGKNVSAIGLAMNPTLDPNAPKFQWTDCGLVIQSANNDDFNTIDPAVSQDADGRLWLAFGSFWSGIKLIQLDPKTGKRIAPDSPMYSLAHNDSIEASYIYRHSDFYYLFVNWGLCCRGTNSTYEIRIGRSKKITGPYFDADGVDLLNDGGTAFLKTSGPFIGPGHAGIISENGTDWFSCHFYDGSRRGISTLAILPLQWQTNGWPEIIADRMK
jgi:arabinan endo-1,5-alpha-L-arabinosidase